MRLNRSCNILMAILMGVLVSATVSADDRSAVVTPEYSRDVAPLLKKYCSGCHNDDDAEADFSVETFASLSKGTGKEPGFLAGDARSSKLIRLMTGSEPAMPPEDEPQPTKEEVALIGRWIDGGAKGPEGREPDRMTLIVPDIESHTDLRPVTSLDVSADGTLAIAQHDTVSLRRHAQEGKPEVVGQHPGPVNAVHFVGDDRLLTASGVVGRGGVARLWKLDDNSLIREFKGHRDILYDAELSPDGSTLATCSYDKLIILWDVHTGEQLRELGGHNGAVYDIAFSPDGQHLVSASADDTCKVWRVSDGRRMDTLAQPLREAYTCAFSPDGRFIVAGGADNRIRVWRFVSKNKPRINPPVHARFAHEGAVLRVVFTPDGRQLVSVAEDRTIKVWETRGYTERQLWEHQSDVPAALGLRPGGRRFTVGRMDGTIESFLLPETKRSRSGQTDNPNASPSFVAIEGEMVTITEHEPNNAPQSAQSITAPAIIQGVIHHQPPKEDDAKQPVDLDADYFRFTAKAGQEWVIETNAARTKSPLDTFVEALDADGHRIERVVLQAIRDSYFTFRGKNASQTNDFRVFNWQEMDLNQYFYANGEVVKLWMHPRGPDSGFNVYPGMGTRYSYFDTTGLSHALGEPAYIVVPHAPGTELIPNGLPTFTLYHENDDASRRDIGKDSRLYFTAPVDGEYLVKLKDVRGMQGADFKYTLSVRPRQPDFRVTCSLTQGIAPGSHQEFTVKAKRIDGFDGPIQVDIAGTLPAGFSVTSPVIIEAGQQEAYGVISAAKDAAKPTEENAKSTTLTASAVIRGEQKTHNAGMLGEIKLADTSKLNIIIKPAPNGAKPLPTSEGEPLAFEIQPGQTIMLLVEVERIDHKGEVSFGKEYSGRNLPHGVYVDNIGLNGLLLLADQTQREFFLTCDEVVQPGQSRLFHLSTSSASGHASQPVMIHVVSDDRVAEN